jgi:2-dehydro-3-deoxyglucarate aldolase
MGMPGEYDKPEVIAALRHVEERCKFFNKPLGFHVIDPDHKLIEEKLSQGYTFLAFSLDFFYLGNKAREQMALLKH